MRSRRSQLSAPRQDAATSRQVVQMRRETAQIIPKKFPQQDGRCRGLCGANNLKTSEASTWCADHRCKAPLDMLTGESKRACLCREVPTDHEAHSRSSGGCRRAGVLISARKASVGGVPEAESGHAKHARIHSEAPVRCKMWSDVREGWSLPASDAQHVSEHAVHGVNSSPTNSSWRAMMMSRRA